MTNMKNNEKSGKKKKTITKLKKRVFANLKGLTIFASEGFKPKK